MSNGAAGCGYEYNTTGSGNVFGVISGRCGFLERDKTDPAGFKCQRHHTPLTTHHITGHPFRCEDCLKGKKVTL